MVFEEKQKKKKEKKGKKNRATRCEGVRVIVFQTVDAFPIAFVRRTKRRTSVGMAEIEICERQSQLPIPMLGF